MSGNARLVATTIGEGRRRTVNRPEPPSGGRTLAIILLVMVALLAALSALAIWAADGV